jgi:hypothetical protein
MNNFSKQHVGGYYARRICKVTMEIKGREALGEHVCWFYVYSRLTPRVCEGRKVVYSCFTPRVCEGRKVVYSCFTPRVCEGRKVV